MILIILLWFKNIILGYLKLLKYTPTYNNILYFIHKIKFSNGILLKKLIQTTALLFISV